MHRMMKGSVCVHVCVCGVQEGLTSLMLAAQNGHTNVVKALLDAKANPNITDKVRVHSSNVWLRNLANCICTDCWVERTVLCSEIGQSYNCPTLDCQRS